MHNMHTCTQALLLIFFIVSAASTEWCYDGAALSSELGVGEWPNCDRVNSSLHAATIEEYRQDWELIAEDTGEYTRYWVGAQVTIGYHASTQAAAKVGFKVLHDDVSGWTFEGRSIYAENVRVEGQDGETLDSALDTFFENGQSVRVVKWKFPGEGLTTTDGRYTVRIHYRMEQAACRGSKYEEFSAPWANSLTVPVQGNVRYSFTLPSAGEWLDDAESAAPSPWLKTPTSPAAQYDTPAGKGPRVSYTFQPSELGIGSVSPSNIVFRWRSGAANDVNDLRQCDSASDDSFGASIVLVAAISAATFVLMVCATAYYCWWIRRRVAKFLLANQGQLPIPLPHSSHLVAQNVFSKPVAVPNDIETGIVRPAGNSTGP